MTEPERPRICVLKHSTEHCGDHARDICVAVDLAGGSDETVCALVERLLPNQKYGGDYISIRRVIPPEYQP